MGLLQQAKQGFFWTFLQQFSVQLINFGVQIVLARLLLPSDFGLIAMISIFIALGQSLSDSGMTSSLIRNEKNSENDYGTVFLTNLFLSIIIYFIIYFIAPSVAIFYNQDILVSILRVYGLVFIISSFSLVQVTKLTKELNFKSQFTLQLPSVLMGATVGILMAFKDYGVWSLVGLNVVQTLSFTVFLWFFNKWRPKIIFDKTVFWFHFEYGYKLTISSIMTTVYLNLYKVIIGKNFAISTVGFFTQADNLRQFPVNQLANVFNKVTFPLFASIQHDKVKLKSAYKIIMQLVLVVCASLMFILMLIAYPLYSIVFGEKWLEAVPYFQILCLASVFLPINMYNLNILRVMGRSDLYLKVDVIKKTIGVVALVSCIPFGINAIVWSLCLTNIFFAYLNGYFSGKLINYHLKEQLVDTLKIIFLSVIPLMVIYYLEKKFFVSPTISDWLRITVIPLIYMIMFIPLIWVFEKKLVLEFLRILKSKN